MWGKDKGTRPKIRQKGREQKGIEGEIVGSKRGKTKISMERRK